MKQTPAAAPPTLTFRAAVAPQSIDADSRSVEITFTTGAPVERYDWNTGRRFLEVLSLAPGHVRLDRLNAGAPLLDAHSGYSVASVLGAVEPGSARIAKGEGRARVRFSKREAVRDVWGDVADGILRSVSVGYRVHAWAPEEAGAAGKLPTRKAIDWEPFEVSLVPIAADAAAAVREGRMENETTTAAPGAVEQERERAAGILTACRTARLPELADELVREGVSLAAAQSRIFEAMAARDGDDLGPGRVPSGAPGGHSSRSLDVAEDFRQAAADALLLQAGIAPGTMHPGARDVDASVVAIARTCVGRAGRTVRGSSPDTLVRAAMTTSDFPSILENALSKSIRQGYESEPASHRAWVRVQPVRDFRSNRRPILGSAPALLEVLEHGEYTAGAMDDDLASYAVTKSGRIVSLTWETIVNDDLGAFLRVQPALGQAARRREADLVYENFTANAGAGVTMQDSVALFHSGSHGNVTGAHAALDATALGEARSLMRMQEALGGGFMSLVPRFLIVAPSHEQAGEVLLAASSRVRFGTVDEATEGRPAWLSSLDLVVEPRLAGLDAAYLAAGNDQIDTIELGLLEANLNGPMIEQRQEFVIDIIAWKCRHVAGAKALDWRGLVKIDLSGS
jgi:hypothetical protein